MGGLGGLWRPLTVVLEASWAVLARLGGVLEVKMREDEAKMGQDSVKNPPRAEFLGNYRAV